jgi:glycosyltransferase involved in cell wall biosynthesis
LVFAEPGAVRAACYAPLLGLGFDRPPLVVLHGTEILRFTALPHRRLFFRRFLDSADRILVLSEANRALLDSRLPGLRSEIVVAAGAPSRWARDNLGGPPASGMPGERLTVLTVGRIHPRKGQLETLEALRNLDPALRDRIRYRIVGPSVRRGYRRRIENLARKSPFPVELTGPLDDADLREAYAAADLFALCSQPRGHSIEGFGLVYLDAASSGLPVVATRTGGVPEAVLDGQTGLLADPGSTESLARCFAKLLSEPESRRAMGEAGRAHAASLRWEIAAGRLLEGLPGDRRVL